MIMRITLILGVEEVGGEEGRGGEIGGGGGGGKGGGMVVCLSYYYGFWECCWGLYVFYFEIIF